MDATNPSTRALKGYVFVAKVRENVRRISLQERGVQKIELMREKMFIHFASRTRN